MMDLQTQHKIFSLHLVNGFRFYIRRIAGRRLHETRVYGHHMEHILGCLMQMICGPMDEPSSRLRTCHANPQISFEEKRCLSKKAKAAHML